MDKKLKEKWIKKLRSGRLRQGRGRLVMKDAKGYRYCCLGVLARAQGHSIAEIRKRNGKLCMLPLDADREEMNLRQTLAEMNDGIRQFKKHTFAEIADYIEKNL